LGPRIGQMQSAGFVGIFIPMYSSGKAAKSKTAGHSQENFMTRISSTGQFIEHVLLCALRYPS
jgi:hypothetical protein